MPDEFNFVAGKYQCVAARSDRAWGHGLEISLRNEADETLNVLHFACHPELPDFDVLQAMSTEQLIELAARRLRTGELDQNLEQCRTAGLLFLVSFKLEP